MPPVVFETTISAGERPQTYALDGAAAGADISDKLHILINIDWVYRTVRVET
jgi:hypothetical protein